MGKKDISPPISERTRVAVIGGLSNLGNVRIRLRVSSYLSLKQKFLKDIRKSVVRFKVRYSKTVMSMILFVSYYVV